MNYWVITGDNMHFEEDLRNIINYYKNSFTDIFSTINRIKKHFGVTPRVVLYKEWYEDETSKTGWSDSDWLDEDGDYFSHINNFELELILESDKYGNITKALFKYVD